MIHITVKMVLEKSRNATALCNGNSRILLLGNRIKNRHMDILVYAGFGVSKVFATHRWGCKSDLESRALLLLPRHELRLPRYILIPIGKD